MSGFNKNFLLDEFLTHLPVKRKNTPGGWTSYNCPHCMSNGETRPDNRMRGGLKMLGDGSFVINCFNCKFKALFAVGQRLSKKMKAYMTSLGFTNDEIKKLNFKAWQIAESADADPVLKKELEDFNARLKFDQIQWPSGAKVLGFWANQANPPENFINSVNYLASRGDDVFGAYEYYWSPNPYKVGPVEFKDLPERIIIPFYWKGKLVGFHARTYKDAKTFRYVGHTPHNYLFNCDTMDLNRDYILIVEGVFDAIALNCVGALGSTLSDEQIRWLKVMGKKVVILPDRDKAGKGLIDIAIKHNWYVSFPWEFEGNNPGILDGNMMIGDDVGDPAEAVKKYGRFVTLKAIMDNITNNPTKITNLATNI